jgi:F0F1-type ATP synthase assembly protein I
VHHHWKSAGSYSTVGLEFALSVIFGLFAGQWLDKEFSTGGWCTAVGFCFGLAAGIRAIYRALQRANREADQAREEAEDERQKYLDGNDP